MKLLINLLLLFTFFLLLSCSSDSLETSLKSISEKELELKVKTIGSDDFLGRAPATLGEVKTINYLKAQFEQMGLKPANGSSYFQEVHLARISTVLNSVKTSIQGNNQSFQLSVPKDFVIGTTQVTDNTSVSNSDLIFVGYGVVAPEYNWNDYEGVDVKGKTVVVLINDPGFLTDDISMFNGKEMTYYGRWTYKFEEAARQGAAGILIIHDNIAAGYGWSVVENTWTTKRFYLDSPDKNMGNCKFNGWLTNQTARKIFNLSNLDFEKLVASASTREFKSIPLPLKISVSFKSEIENVKSNNVIAYLPGKQKPDEYIIYTAHWDHFGVNNTLKGDTILNGALDNGVAVASILQAAKAFTQLQTAQNRSVVFMALTCEEFGLLGSEYYALNPIFPLNKTVAIINLEMPNIFGKTKDITVYGYKNSELDKYAEEVVKKYNRYISSDPFPQNGMYFRSDHFSFVRRGVPALYFTAGVDNFEKGKEWGMGNVKSWIAKNYHKPSDEYLPGVWKFDCLAEDVKIFFEVGYKLSMIKEFPNWFDESIYKAKRDEMMK